MFIDNRAVLPIADVNNNFGSDVFLRGQNVTEIQNDFAEIGTSVYIGCTNKIRTDHGSVFMTWLWLQLLESS